MVSTRETPTEGHRRVLQHTSTRGVGASTPGELVAMSARMVRVFPRPMSSARMPPRNGGGRVSVTKLVRVFV